MTRTGWKILTAILFLLAGVNHFVRPRMYLRMMPPVFPFPVQLVWISGAFEIAGGVGLLVPQLQTAASWGLILLLGAVFPANIYMATDANRFIDLHIPKWALWARLLLQPMLIAWVWWVAKNKTTLPTRQSD